MKIYIFTVLQNSRITITGSPERTKRHKVSETDSAFAVLGVGIA